MFPPPGGTARGCFAGFMHMPLAIRRRAVKRRAKE